MHANDPVYINLHIASNHRFLSTFLSTSFNIVSPPTSQHHYLLQDTIQHIIPIQFNMSAYTNLFETVARFSIKHIGAEKTYQIFTSFVLLCARIKQLQIAIGASSLLAYLMIPTAATIIIISIMASSMHVRIGCPLLMLVILWVAIDAELASYGLSF